MQTSLPTRPLGGTGMDITTVGFGAWAIGGGGWTFAWGDQADDESIAAIRHAVEAGVNWIDTAAVYGLGHSEEVVAEALAPLADSDRPFVFTKAGLVWDEADRRQPPRRVGDPTSIRREVEASLQRLKVERIDLYQMHWPAEDGARVDDYWAVFVDLRAEGKIRAAGLSNHDPDLLQAAERIGHVDSIQPMFNLIHRKAAGDVLPWAAEHGTGAIVYSPMASGLLTGSFSRQRASDLPDDDWRSRSPDYREPALSANLRLAEALVPVARRHQVSPAAVAVAWTLTVPGTTGAIVGARSAEQVDGWLQATGVKLDRDDLAQLARAVEDSGAGDGPVPVGGAAH